MMGEGSWVSERSARERLAGAAAWQRSEGVARCVAVRVEPVLVLRNRWYRRAQRNESLGELGLSSALRHALPALRHSNVGRCGREGDHCSQPRRNSSSAHRGSRMPRRGLRGSKRCAPSQKQGLLRNRHRKRRTGLFCSGASKCARAVTETTSATYKRTYLRARLGSERMDRGGDTRMLTIYGCKGSTDKCL